MQLLGQQIPGKVAAGLIFSLSLAAVFVLWQVLGFYGFISLILAFLGGFIFFATHRDKSIPFLSSFLTRTYFKLKFKITEIENGMEKNNKVERALKLVFYITYLKISYFLIILFKNPQESFEAIREEFQRENKGMMIVDTSNDAVFSIEHIEERIKNGEEIDPDILVEYYQKLFTLYKKQQRKAAHYSIGTLAVMILATVISGTVTSLIFNNTKNIFAATYNFTQQSWAGGVSGTTATHADNQSGWTYYSTSSPSGLAIGTDLSLATSSFWFTDDGTVSTSSPANAAAGGGFDNGTNASTTISGSGTGASVILSAGRSAGSRTDYTVGNNPNDIAFDSTTNSAWILNGNNVSKVDVSTGSKADYTFGAYATLEDITFDAVNSAIWIARGTGGGLSKVDINTGGITSYDLGIYAKGVAYDNITNSVWLTTSVNTIVKYNVSTGTSSSYALTSTGNAVAFDSTTNSVWTIYPTDYRVAKVNIYTGARTDYNAGGWNPNDIVFDDVTDSVWVLIPGSDQVKKINANTGEITATYSTGDLPKSITFDSLTQSVWVANYTAHTVSKIDIDSGTKTDYQALYFTDEYGQIFGPQGIAFDSTTNSVWISSYSSASGANVSKMAVGDLYNSSGVFTSAVIDLGGQSNFSTLDFTASTSASSTISIDVRAGNTSSPDGSWMDWVAGIADNGSLAALDGYRYIQYRINASTANALATPELNDLKINYTQYVSSANLTSSIYDSGDNFNLVAAINWSETGTSTDETIRFQIRSASSSAGIASAAWCGYSEVSTSTCAGTEYFETGQNGVNVASTHPLRNGDNDRYFQYRAILSSGGSATPTLDDIMVTYVVNASPEVQNFTATQGSDGYVQINYEVRDVDSISGTATPGVVTPSFEYWNGSVWVGADTFAAGDLDNKAVNTEATTTWTSYSATWNPNTDFDGEYMNGTFKMRITINDNEAANNTVQLESSTFTLDTADPAPGSVPVRIIATTTEPLLQFDVTDDSVMDMRISLNSDFSGASWASSTATSTIALPSQATSTIYAEFKDERGNTYSTQVIVPETPSAMMIQDTSNLDIPEYRLFTAWKTPATPNPGFGSYRILRSDDGGVNYTQVTSIGDIANNYYGDGGLTLDQEYYYKVYMVDANGNTSFYSDIVNKIVNGIGVDNSTPDITSVEVTATTTQTATIEWDTNKLSNSTVEYSTTPGSYTTVKGVSTMKDNAAGTGRHQVVVSGLTPNTTYYFQVKSTDANGNTGTNDNSSSGYSFTTKPGAVISDVTTSQINNNGATIVWNTDIPADSIVYYSTNSDLADPVEVQGSASLVTAHSISVSSLTAGTRYYYYVKSTDSESNAATDNNAGVYYSFLTSQDTTPPNITFNSSSDITNIGTSTATISWSTDQAASSTLAYGTTESGPYDNREDNSNYNYNHSVILTGLTASTTYYFQLMNSDANGNSTTSAEFSFSTLALPDTTAPVISSVSTSTTISTATISWTTDENASSFIQYATTTDSFDSVYVEKGRSATTTSHSVTLTGLTENVTYYFRVRSTDVDGNTATDDNSGNYYSFTTTRDSTAPVISAISESPITDTSAVITWTTDEGATSHVAFGTAAGTYSSSTAINTNLNKSHSATLNNLTQNTAYYYVVVSTDASGNTATSTEGDFTTRETLSTESEVQAREDAARTDGQNSSTGGGVLIIDKTDKSAPVITNIQIQSIKSDSAVVTWNTNEEGDSFVEYEKDKKATVGQRENVRSHTVNLTELAPETEYRIKISSADSWGNVSVSDAQAFKTLSLSAEIISGNTDEGEGDSGSLLIAAVNKTIDFMNRIASQVSLNTMQDALMAQYNSIENLATLIPAPIMSGEPRVEVTATTVKISWRTDKESNSLVAIAKEGEYDTSKSDPYKQVVGLPKDKSTEHTVEIYNLEPDTVYHYQLRSEAPVGPVARSSDFIFRTPQEALEISSYTADIESPEKATFRWITSTETDSEIKYTPYRNNVISPDETKYARDKAFTTVHEITIDNFEGGTIYQIELVGKNVSGGIVSMTIPTFFTSETDLPPTISQVQTNLAISPGKDSKIQAVISWVTDEPTTSRVFFQKGFAASSTDMFEKTPLDTNYTKKHAVVVTKFEPGAIYTFRAESTDSSGNTTLSKTYTILAPKQKETVFQVIMKNFESMFGWVGNVKQ